MGDRMNKLARAVKAVVKRATKISGEHELKNTIVFDVWYPDHAERSNSTTFNHTRDLLIGDGRGECFICGAKDDLEAHHWHVEWAFAEGVDWEKMRTLHPGFSWTYFKEPEDFVDSPYNMVILCEKHHRHKNHGIHNLPYPIWIMQKHQSKAFVFCASDCCQTLVPVPTLPSTDSAA